MPAVFERLECAGHLVALHREQADFRLDRVAFVFAADERLVVPDDVFERERNLLPGFVLDDVGNLLALDRRQLDEPRQAALAGNRDRHAVARHVVARDELLERFADQLVAIGFGLRENLRIFDVVEGLDDHPLVVLLVRTAAQRFQRALANIDAPNGVTLRHDREPLSRNRRHPVVRRVPRTLLQL